MVCLVLFLKVNPIVFEDLVSNPIAKSISIRLINETSLSPWEYTKMLAINILYIKLRTSVITPGIYKAQHISDDKFGVPIDL